MAIVGSLMQIAFWAIVIPTAFYLLTQTVSTLIYSIGVMFFSVMDLLQSTFRKLAGLGGGVAIGGEPTDDLVTALLSNDTIIDILISVTVFAIGLIIVASIVQIIRLEYTTEGSKNSKEQIFAKAGKSLIMFILIPIICFVGIRISNYLLVAIDYATSSAGASTVSGCVFTSAAAEASKVYDIDKNDNFYIDISNLLGSLLGNIPGYGSANLKQSGDTWTVEYFEDWFSTNASSRKEAESELADQVAQSFTYVTVNNAGMIQPGRPLSTYTASSDPYSETILTKGAKLSYMDPLAVRYFYHPGNINYLILFLGCYFGIKTLFTACMGLIVRLYKIAALFVISPAAIGLQPLDDGNAYKQWRSNFIKNVLSCYGIIVALNLYFIIVGVLQTVELWIGWQYYVANKFVQFMMVLAGATQINQIAGVIGGLIGAGDVMQDGQSATAEVGKLASGVAKVAGGAMGGATKAIGGKLKAKMAQNKTKFKDKDGNTVTKDSLATVQKNAGMDVDAEVAKAAAGFDNDFVEEGGRIYKKGANGEKAGLVTDAKELKKANKALEHKNANSKEALEKKKKDAQYALDNDKDYATQATAVAQGRAQAMMGRAAMGAALNPMQMLAPIDNLLGGVSKYVSGEAFKATDEKYLENLEKQGVDTKALGLEAGKTGPLDTVNKGLGGVFGLKKKKEDWQTGRVKDYQDMANANNENRNAREQAEQAVDQEAENARQNAENIQAQADHMQGKMDAMKTENANIDLDADYRTASALGTSALGRLRKGMEQFASGTIDEATFRTMATTAQTSVGGIVDEGERDAAKDLIASVLSELDKHGAGSDAQKGAINNLVGTTFTDANIEATLQDGNAHNKRMGYGTTAEREEYRGLQEEHGKFMEDKAVAEQRAKDLTDNKAQYVEEAARGASESGDFAKNFAEEFAKVMQANNMAGGNADAYDAAMKKLAEKLKTDGIKAKLDGLDESKFKIDDANIIKTLKDIQTAINQQKDDKKGDDDGKTLKDILKELKKGNKK